MANSISTVRKEVLMKNTVPAAFLEDRNVRKLLSAVQDDILTNAWTINKDFLDPIPTVKVFNNPEDEILFTLATGIQKGEWFERYREIEDRLVMEMGE